VDPHGRGLQILQRGTPLLPRRRCDGPVRRRPARVREIAASTLARRTRRLHASVTGTPFARLAAPHRRFRRPERLRWSVVIVVSLTVLWLGTRGVRLTRVRAAFPHGGFRGDARGVVAPPSSWPSLSFQSIVGAVDPRIQFVEEAALVGSGTRGAVAVSPAGGGGGGRRRSRGHDLPLVIHRLSGAVRVVSVGVAVQAGRGGAVGVAVGIAVVGAARGFAAVG